MVGIFSLYEDSYYNTKQRCATAKENRLFSVSNVQLSLHHMRNLFIVSFIKKLILLHDLKHQILNFLSVYTRCLKKYAFCLRVSLLNGVICYIIFVDHCLMYILKLSQQAIMHHSKRIMSLNLLWIRSIFS